MKNLSIALCISILTLFSCNPGKKEFGVEISSDASQILKGRTLFEKQCSTCHNFNEDAIGPNLSGLTRQIETLWIREFIKNPAKAIEEKDPRAVQLLAKYKSQMPGFPDLADQDIDALLSYMHTFETLPIYSKNTVNMFTYPLIGTHTKIICNIINCWNIRWGMFKPSHYDFY